MKTAYFKLNPKAVGYSSAIAALRHDFAQAFPGNELSINTSQDGTQAWCKVCADSDVPDAVLLDSAPAEDVARVQAEVSEENWTGPREQRGPKRR